MFAALRRKQSQLNGELAFVLRITANFRLKERSPALQHSNRNVRKCTFGHVCPAKIQISLRECAV